MRRKYDFSKGKRGPVIRSPGKTRITIMIDDDVLARFRSRAEAEGKGYQTMINAALQESLRAGRSPKTKDRPVTVRDLRRVIREELRAS
jgi:hypothetical protein